MPAITNIASDASVLAELGDRLQAYRVTTLRLTQQELAYEAGVSLPTLRRIEAGTPVRFDLVIRVLRTLELLDRLDALVPSENEPNPLDVLARRRRRPQRVRKG